MESLGTDAYLDEAPADVRAEYVMLEPVQTQVLASTLMALQASGREIFAATPMPGTGMWRIMLVDKASPLRKPTPD